ncbi:MAG: hypothetical protein AB8H12_10965 [Lewinella sp.]
MIGCEKKDSLQIQEGIYCLTVDCISSSNPNIVGSLALEPDLIPISQIRKVFKNQWSSESHFIQIFEKIGYPAWNLSQGINGENDAFQQTYVPFIGKDSDRIDALLVATKNEAEDEIRLKFIPRHQVTKFPLENKVLRNSETNRLTQLSIEALISTFMGIEEALFESSHHDLYALHPDNSIQLRDCQWETHYIEECWVISAGGVVRYITCTNTDIETVFVGCTGGLGGVPNLGGGGNGGTTTTSGNPTRDPCKEDGKGCPEDDTDDEEEELNILLSLLLNKPDNVNNNIDPSVYPCGHGAVSDFQSQLGGTLGEILNNIFNATETIELNIAVDPGLIGSGDHAVTTRETSLPGIYMGGTIKLNPDFLNCTKDEIYSTLLHELIHAYINFNADNLSYEEFNARFPGYPSIAYGSPNDGFTNYAHHVIIAERYTNEIRLALLDYNPNLLPQAAWDLSWVGLQSTQAFRDLPESDRNSIGLTNSAANCSTVTGDTRTYNWKPC